LSIFTLLWIDLRVSLFFPSSSISLLHNLVISLYFNCESTMSIFTFLWIDLRVSVFFPIHLSGCYTNSWPLFILIVNWFKGKLHSSSFFKHNSLSHLVDFSGYCPHILLDLSLFSMKQSSCLTWSIEWSSKKSCCWFLFPARLFWQELRLEVVSWVHYH
jgi:hypothetical protein